MPGPDRSNGPTSESDDLQLIADFVDGESSRAGVGKYELVFETDAAGHVTLTMLADDSLGGVFGVVTTETAPELRKTLLEWRRLISLEKSTPPPPLAAVPEIHERRRRLFLPSSSGEATSASSGEDAPPAVEADERRGVELGCHVYLDEDVYNGVHVPPRVYLFEAYDSDAPEDANCTLVDQSSGDWQMRGVGELVPVDEDAVTDDTATGA